MKAERLLRLVVLSCLGCAILFAWQVSALQGAGLVPLGAVRAQEGESKAEITGQLIDSQNQPIVGADILLVTPQQDEPLVQTLSQPDGSFLLALPAGSQSDPGALPTELAVRIERHHFDSYTHVLTPDERQLLVQAETVSLPEITLQRHIGAAFWVATGIFILVLTLIALGSFHNTLSTLLGVSLIYAVSYLAAPLISEQLYIFGFTRSLVYVDWNVIFLIMGMMIIIAVVERTGIFQWLAFNAYRIARGRMWLLMLILMLFTGIASAFLDNVTTMLLMTPITIQIALALNLNPLALLLPEVFASNVAGISTLVGTPTNILIGSYARISFNDFLINQTPGVVLALIGLGLYCAYIYRTELQHAGDISPRMLASLEERAQITDPANLKKAGIVGAGMVVLFVVGERFHMLPAVTALMGATALILWIRPNIEEMIEAVDWTTLVFFITLFIVVGAVQEVGLISLVASAIGRVVGTNLALAMLVVTYASALLSTVIANIPFTAAMLPVIGFLSASIPAASNKVLFYCLSMGSAMGGNGSLIGASANMVTAGISDRAGYTISYGYFLRKGMPGMLITITLGLIWLFIRFG